MVISKQHIVPKCTIKANCKSDQQSQTKPSNLCVYLARTAYLLKLLVCLLACVRWPELQREVLYVG